MGSTNMARPVGRHHKYLDDPIEARDLEEADSMPSMPSLAEGKGCIYCNEVFADNPKLYGHMRIRHPGRPVSATAAL